jgi:hypothetical protein
VIPIIPLNTAKKYHWSQKKPFSIRNLFEASIHDKIIFVSTNLKSRMLSQFKSMKIKLLSEIIIEQMSIYQ